MEQNLENLEDVPIVDLPLLHQNSLTTSLVIKNIRVACQTHGFFHVINHGVPDSVIEEALEVNEKFFEMGTEEKEKLMSDDVCKEVRFGRVQVGEFSRDFLKFYANPLDRYVNSWPTFPPDYREKMGMYSTMLRKLATQLVGAIMESLDLDETHLKESFEQGIQMVGINCYPPCSNGSNIKSGAPPHTDHTIITILLQSAPGLEVINRVDGNSSWENVPKHKGALHVLVGDHLEVISNGLYKSVLHRASIPRCSETRLSIASFHSLGMDEIVVPAPKLENEKNPRRYSGSSLRDYLNHLSSKNTRAFIETIKN